MTSEPGLGLVLVCRDPEALATFWASALGYVTVGSVENYVLLLPDGRPGPKLLLQRVSEDKAGKNRMHVDIEVPDIEGLVTRLEEIGAQRLKSDVMAEHGRHWVLMADPEGNEFCICDGGTSGYHFRPTLVGGNSPQRLQVSGRDSAGRGIAFLRRDAAGSASRRSFRIEMAIPIPLRAAHAGPPQV